MCSLYKASPERGMGVGRWVDSQNTDVGCPRIREQKVMYAFLAYACQIAVDFHFLFFSPPSPF